MPNVSETKTKKADPAGGNGGVYGVDLTEWSHRMANRPCRYDALGIVVECDTLPWRFLPVRLGISMGTSRW